MMVEGGDWASLDVYVCETSLSRFCGLWGGGGRILGLSGSATFEPMRQIPTYRLATFSINIPVEPFALCFTFMFRFVKVFATSSHRTNRTPVMRRISVVSPLDGRGCLCLGR